MKAHGPLKINTETNRQRSVLFTSSWGYQCCIQSVKMYQPSKEYIPQLRQALQKLKKHSWCRVKMAFTQYFSESICESRRLRITADPDLSKHIPFTGYDSKRDFLKRFVEYLLNKNEHGLELLEYLWTSYGVETFNLGVVVLCSWLGKEGHGSLWKFQWTSICDIVWTRWR